MLKIIVLVLLLTNTLFAQKTYEGWIINNHQDTIQCSIFSPRDVPRKIRKGRQAYFYDYILVITGNGKEQRLTPNDIKEYYFEFVSDGIPQKFHGATYTLSHNKGVIIKRQNAGYYNVFVRKLVTNGYYHLFYYDEIDWADGTVDKNFILYKPSDSTSTIFFRTKQLIKILNWPAESERKNERYRDWFKGKQNLVIDYNRQKATSNR